LLLAWENAGEDLWGTAICVRFDDGQLAWRKTIFLPERAFALRGDVVVLGWNRFGRLSTETGEWMWEYYNGGKPRNDVYFGYIELSGDRLDVREAPPASTRERNDRVSVSWETGAVVQP
jgi:hypothetical protein